MIRAPFLARVAVGAAVFALEEARKLPQTAINMPMNAVSQVLQTTMHAQQFVTSLAIKGDQVLELITKAEDQPEWATFDEDLADAPASSTNGHGLHAEHAARPSAAEPEPGVEGGSAESETVAARAWESAAGESKPEETAASAAEVLGRQQDSSAPMVGIIEKIDYPSLSLAQLRARLRNLTVEDLTALLTFENADRQRAPFVTMLTNRIATTTAR